MKTTKWIGMMILFGVILSNNLSAQERAKENEKYEVIRITKDNLKKKSAKDVIKEIRKEAVKLKELGYTVHTGKTSLSEQLENTWSKKAEIDKEGHPAYYISSQTVVAGTYAMAVAQAKSNAKREIAHQIQNGLIQLVSAQVANNRLDENEAIFAKDIVNTSKGIISGTLESALLLAEIYRKLPSGNVEAMVTLGCCAKTAHKAAVEVIKNNIARRSKELAGKIEKIVE